VLSDGSYEAFIFDASPAGEAILLELTVIAGAHKGEVVSVRATGLAVDEIELLGTPATIVVEGGQPRVIID
jgi:hypothetical protein